MPEDETALPSTSKQFQAHEIIGQSSQDDDYMGYRFATEIKQEALEESDLHCYEEMENERSSSGSRNSGKSSLISETKFPDIVSELMITHLHSGFNQYICHEKVEADIAEKFPHLVGPTLRSRIRDSWRRCKTLARKKERIGKKMNERDLRIIDALNEAAIRSTFVGHVSVSHSKAAVCAAISSYFQGRDPTDQLDEDLGAYVAWSFIEDHVEKHHPRNKWALWNVFKDIATFAETKMQKGEKLNRGEEIVTTLISLHPSLAKPEMPLPSLCGLSERADSEERPTTSNTTPNPSNNSTQEVIEIDSDGDNPKKKQEVRPRTIRVIRKPAKVASGPFVVIETAKRRIVQNTTSNNVTYDAQTQEIEPSPFKSIRVVRRPINLETSTPSTSFEQEIDSSIGIYDRSKSGMTGQPIVQSRTNTLRPGGVRFQLTPSNVNRLPATLNVSGNSSQNVPNDPGRPPNKTLPLRQWLNVVDYCRRTNQVFSFDGDAVIFSDPAAPGYEIRLPLDRVASIV
ncbi:unnamed protein product [Bursaphelenchus xylophilus]|uniref:(pine wood nematode) hypothetical protein n=1 Tax=Bursaphelenchus xylophilus TaxID=6326 RepID=A0A1I7SFN5_BURXY|nr:unnamed protein product [Bursaphelenchus xylophilus]CAG9113430.1 unnamed protein product [Bursaphelenchus xylophilus]